MRGHGWKIDAMEVPWSLWAYVATTVISLVVLVTRSIHVEPALFGVVFGGAWDYFLLRGVRWLWIVTAVFLGLLLVVDLATQSGTWFGDVTGVIQVALLILPATRRFFAPEEMRAT